MGIMEAIKKGFGVAAKNMLLILVLFVFNLIWNLASIPLARQGAAAGGAAGAAPQLTAAAAILSIVFILASIFVQGGALALVRDYVKEGKTKLANFVSYGLKYFARLLGLGLLIILIIAIVGLIAALIIAATAGFNNTTVTIIATVVAIVIGVAGLYYIILLILSPYTMICEEIGVIEAMKRSIAIVKRTIGKVLLLLVLLVLISLGIGFLIGFITGLLTMALPANVAQIVIVVINSAFNGYLGLVMMASFMVFYLGMAGQEKISAQKVFKV